LPEPTVSTIPLRAADDAPVQAFSSCHQGIVAQLSELDRLPALAAAAALAQRIAKAADAFFSEVVLAHHAEEEQELFPAVLASAQAGAERERVKGIVERLTREHRHIESAWREIAPAVHQLAKGHEAALDATRIGAFVAEYRMHADHEEREFLPLASQILGRNGNHMAALGASLHARHALPEVLRRYGSRV
jgi:hemerythrin-like domain-containing protein